MVEAVQELKLRFFIHLAHIIFHLISGARAEYALGSTFGDQGVSPFFCHDHSKAPSFEVERNLIRLFETAGVRNRSFENGDVKRAFDSCLKLLFRKARKRARSEGFPDGSRDEFTDIVPAVSVPVLSLQSTSMLPKF